MPARAPERRAIEKGVKERLEDALGLVGVGGLDIINVLLELCVHLACSHSNFRLRRSTFGVLSTSDEQAVYIFNTHSYYELSMSNGLARTKFFVSMVSSLKDTTLQKAFACFKSRYLRELCNKRFSSRDSQTRAHN